MRTSRPKFALVPAIAILCLAAGTACGGGGGGSPTASPAAPTPPASPTPTATVTPEVIGGVEVVPLEIGDEAKLPEGVALIIETGCWQCDGPPAGLVRVYRDPSGQARTDTLFTAKATGLPPRAMSSSKEGIWPEEPYITGFALGGDASEIVVGVCSRGYCGGLGWASPDAQTTLFRSLDGGVTWAVFGTVDGGYNIVGIATNGVVLWDSSDPAQQAGPRYRLFPNGDPVQPPLEAEDNWPLSLPGGELIWPTKDGRLVRSDGSEFLALGEGASFVNAWRKNIELDPSGKRMVTTWRTAAAHWPSGQDYVGVVSPGGELTEAFSAPAYATVGGWVTSELLIGNASISTEELTTPAPERFLGYLPALFDLDARLIHPIPHPFLDPSFPYGRNFVQAVLRGPFARVVETGSCLNVRADPGMATQVLACAADGVLLRDTGEAREVDGVTWRRVVTPAGVEGWASTQHLQE